MSTVSVWKSPLIAAIALSAALASSAPLAAAPRSVGPDGGSVVDLAIDPHAPGTVYAATATGGVYRSADGGATWASTGKRPTFRTVQWIEVDPGSVGTLWLGVENPGEPALWRSKDRGASWSKVTDSYKGSLGSLHPVGYRIAFAPSKPAEIWVPSTNLHFRSRDGGKSWSDFRVLAQDAYAIAIDPRDPKVVYAGGHGGEATHLARSDDGGKSWKAVGSGLEPPIEQIAIDPTSPDQLWVATRGGKLFLSTDRGATFTAAGPSIGATDDIEQLRFAPDGSLWAATEGGLHVRDRASGSWKRVDRGTGRYVVAAVAFDPAAPGNVLAATGDGVYRSADGGATWQESSSGLAATWIERLDASSRSPLLFAQTSRGLFRRDGSGSWSELSAPFETDGDEVELDGLLFDRSAPATVWAFDASTAWRSADAGVTFKELEKKSPKLRDMMKGSSATAQFRSLEQDPGDAKILYAGSWSNDGPGQAVFKSVDGGKSWKPSGNGLPAEDVVLLRSEAAGNVLAVVDKALYRTTDSGTTWAAAGTGLPAQRPREVAIDPANPALVFAACESGLYRSSDGGVSFARVESGLAKEDVEAVAIAPGGRIFAGSFRGLFASKDGGDTFALVEDGPVHPDVRALAVGAGPSGGLLLWIGTAGGGVFEQALD